MTIFWSLPLVEHADCVLTEKKILSQKKKKKKIIIIIILKLLGKTIVLLTYYFLFLCPQNTAWMLIAVYGAPLRKLQGKYFWENLERIGEFVGIILNYCRSTVM